MNKKKYFINAVKLSDYHKIKSLLGDPDLNEYKKSSNALQHTALNGSLVITNLLLNDGNFNPSLKNNYAINVAYQKGYHDIVEELWKDKKVKTTLKNDNIELFNILISKDVKEKVKEF